MKKREQPTASRLQFSSADINRLEKHALRFTELGFTRFKVVRRRKDDEIEFEITAPHIQPDAPDVARDQGWGGV